MGKCFKHYMSILTVFKVWYFLTSFSGSNTLLVTLLPQRATLQENETFKLSCSYDNGIYSPDTISCLWKRKHDTDIEFSLIVSVVNGTPLFASTVKSTDFSTSYDLDESKRLFTLEKNVVERSDHNTTWICWIFTTKRSISNNATLYVNVPIKQVTLLYPNKSHVRVIEDENTTFICRTSEGRPRAWISWYKRKQSTENITNFSQTNVSSLTNGLFTSESTLQFSLQREDNGSRINCTAGNTQSDMSSQRDILVHVQFPVTIPSLYIARRNVTGTLQEVCKGKNLTIVCKSDGDPFPHYSWTDENNTRTVTGSDFSLTNITKIHSGRYWCHAQNIMTSSTEKRSNHSSPVKVGVFVPPRGPKIYYHYDGQNISLVNTSYLAVVLGDEFRVFCNSTGYPHPNCSCVGIPVVNNNWTRSHLEDTNITCNATNLMTDHAGDTCDGAQVLNLTLDVLYSPYNVSIEFTNVTVNKTDLSDTLSVVENSSFILTCTAKSNPPSTYKWTRILLLIDNVSLAIGSVQRKDHGSYTCHANNKMKRSNGTPQLGYGNKTIFLDVLYHATVKRFAINGITEEKVTVTEMNSVNLSCSVDSNPKASLRIISPEKELASNNSTRSLTFILRNVSCLHKGNYTCKGRNSYNNNHESKSVRSLFVNCSPRPSPAVQFDQHIMVAVKSPVKLTFTALAYPEPTFHWYKRSEFSNLELTSSERLDIFSNGLQTSLTISNVTETDYGEYVLNISNSLGSYTQTYNLSFDDVTTEPVPVNQNEQSKNIVGIVLGIVFGVIGIIAVTTLGICLSRNRKGADPGKLTYQNIPFTGKNLKRKKSTEPPAIDETSLHTLQELDDAPILTSEPTEYYNSPDKIEKIDRIKVSELFAYVHDRSTDAFAIDYQKLPTGLQRPCTFARKPENIALNRYNGIYPYDHSRVKILSQPDFFMNACYIDGYAKQKSYIASLGPTSKTTDDFKTFWKMVWYEQSDIIVMLTNLNEPSGVKCEQYWPKLGDVISYGEIDVSCNKEDIFAEYTTRVFTISSAGERRGVTQLHYTAWPDKKVPEDVSTLLEFRQSLKATHTSGNGPIIVHCSAGIGRTGTLIALDILTEEGMCKMSVNVFKCVDSMREQRVKMVQTQEQYIYIFKALVNMLYFDYVTVSLESFDVFVNTTNNNTYSQQFQQLKLSVETRSEEELTAYAENKKLVNKNRHGADIPGAQHRVHLYLNREMGDSDYINAVYANSFKKKDHFIIAQSPLVGNVSDFICMVYQEECCCVVTMEDLYEPGMKVGKYLPSEGKTLKLGDFSVSCKTLETKPTYTVREMKIKNGGKYESGEKVIYHFQYNKWMPGDDAPAHAKEFVQFIKDVEDYAEQLGEETSHVLVHCLKANERSALYCVVTILMEKMRYERQVSVLNTVRHLKTRRWSAIKSMEQLKFCYEAVSTYIRLLEP